jgi:hypothetical protein
MVLYKLCAIQMQFILVSRCVIVLENKMFCAHVKLIQSEMTHVRRPNSDF